MTLVHARPASVDAEARAHVAGGQVSGLLARKVVDRLPSAGEPLTAAARTSLGAASGHDLSHVRVHRDGYAADTARAFGARALTAGQHVLLGAAPTGATTERVLAHEVGHAVSQARSGDPVVQLDAIDQVEELLSYSIVDWAVTDSEAMEALALLNALTDAQLTPALARLDRKYVDRLLDNLPDAARSGPGYQRIVQALGMAGTVGQAVEDLSYGLFDWAVTDTDVTRVYNTFVNLAPVDQESFLMKLEGAGRLARLVSNSSGGHLSLYLHPWIRTLVRAQLTDQQKTLMHTIVEDTDDLTTLTLATSVRFDMTVGRSIDPETKGVDWVPDQLRRTYLVLDALPDAHTAGNEELLSLGQYDQSGENGYITAGAYYRDMGKDTDKGKGPRELGINRVPSGELDRIIRHETGHAVDYAMGWRSKDEPKQQVEFGGWKRFDVTRDAAKAMVSDAAAGISKLAASEQEVVVDDLATEMREETHHELKGRTRAKPWFAKLPAPTQESVLDDPTYRVVEAAHPRAWDQPDQLVPLGEHSHIYESSYPPKWERYMLAARQFWVSNYQFASSGEWFAEAYAWYYAPDREGNPLAPKAKKYFDDVVHPLVRTRNIPAPTAQGATP